jgi:hypothetical protein
MRTPSKKNRTAERYKRVGSENHTVGMASSCKYVSLGIYGVNKKERPDHCVTPDEYPADKEKRNLSRGDAFRVNSSSMLQDSWGEERTKWELGLECP